MPEVRLIDANVLHEKICKDSENNYGTSLNIAQVLLYIETAPTIEPGVLIDHWIPCSERLPEIDTDVIVFYPYWEDKPIQVAHLNYDKLTFELSDGEFNLPTSAVTHWMPLPKTPEVIENAGID